MKRKLRAFALLLTAAAASGPVRGQNDLFSLEAADIFNFTAFTDWPPARSSASNLVVCVPRHNRLVAALARLGGRPVATRIWRVRPLSNKDDLSGCDVLVVDDSAAKSPSTTATLAADLPLLIVHTGVAAESPYVIRLFREGDQLRFDIDNTEALRRHLRLSSKLLRLARDVT